MSGNNSQTTQSNQYQSQNFSDLSNMLESMATQGVTTGNTTQQQQQQQTQTGQQTGATTGQTASQTNPWGPAGPALNNLVKQLQTMQPTGTGLTPAQSTSLGNLYTAAGGIPSFGPNADVAIGNAFNSNNGIPEAGLWGNAYGNLREATSPFTGANWATINNPAINQMINDPNYGLNKNIATSIASEFAGAGRDPAGNVDASKAIAGAESTADLPILLNNQNNLANQTLNAAGQQYGAGAGTAGGITSLMQQPWNTQLQAINAAGNVPGLWTAPATAQLGAANAAYGTPFSNLGLYQNLLAQLGGLGSSTAGTSAGTSNLGTTSTTDLTGQQQQQSQQIASKLASGQSSGNQSGQSSGYSSGTSTTSSPVNPWTTAAGIGLGLFSMMP